MRPGQYVFVAGIDLVRLPDGGFAVLEDNLRVPAASSKAMPKASWRSPSMSPPPDAPPVTTSEWAVVANADATSQMQQMQQQ